MRGTPGPHPGAWTPDYEDGLAKQRRARGIVHEQFPDYSPVDDFTRAPYDSDTPEKWRKQRHPPMRSRNSGLSAVAAVLATVTALSLSWNLVREMQLDYSQWTEYSAALEAERTTRTGLMREAHVLEDMVASQLPPELPPGLPHQARTCVAELCPPPPKCPPPEKDKGVEALFPETERSPVEMTPLPESFDLKIYVYEDLPKQFNADLKQSQPRCIVDQYGTEIRIHEAILSSPLHTKDPDKADLFFVPVYGECYLYRAAQQLGPQKGLDDTNGWFRNLTRILAEERPWWNRTQGRDHIFVFPGARGPNIFKDWKRTIKKSIFLTPEGDRSFGEQFNTWKDVVIPGLEPDEAFWGGGLRDMELERDIFLYFKGTMSHSGAGGEAYSRGIRPKLQKLLSGEPGVVFSEPDASTCDRDCYRKELRRSVFCLCPRGWSPWTLRAYQAMMVGCIPVIIADEIELPYENYLDWSQIAIKIPEHSFDLVLPLLRALPPRVVEAKRAAIAEVWRTVTYPVPSKPGDAMHAIFRELSLKKRRLRASSLTFWT